MLHGMMLYLRKTRPATRSTAFNENSKQLLSGNWADKTWVNYRRTQNKKKTF